MSDLEQLVVDFFLEMQRSINAGDADVIAQSCGPDLLVQDSAGVRTLSNAAFRAVVSDRLQRLRDAGLRDAKALQIDPRPIGERSALARVLWSIWFTPEGRNDFVLEFPYHYLLAFGPDGEIAIVAVIEGDGAAATWADLPGIAGGNV